MPKNIQARDLDGETSNFTVEGVPDSCPICHHGIQPNDLNVSSPWSGGGTVVERVFACPRHVCRRLFIARYTLNRGSGWFYFRDCVPIELWVDDHPAALQAISPDFCSIYDEANKAEQLGLPLVSGPGYRKALEFLVKDYLASVQTSTEAKEEIAAMPLMACIKKFVTDARMRVTAERATWLGNDETHYIRRWEDKDLEDMKNLIQLTCFWIQSEHLTAAATVEMPEGKK